MADLSSDSTSSSGDAPSSNGRFVRTARTAADLARRLTTAVGVLASTSASAGLLLWGVLWWPLSARPIALIAAAATLALLLLPAALLALFYQGLRDLQALPERLSERTSRTAEQSAAAARAATIDAPSGLLGRLWHVIKQIWTLRSVLSENRALLLRYGALLRFVTPGFLLLVLLAASMSLLLVPVAVLAGFLLLLW